MVRYCLQWQNGISVKDIKRLGITVDHDTQAMFMAVCYSLLPQKALSLSLGCEYRSESVGIHIDKSASGINGNEN